MKVGSPLSGALDSPGGNGFRMGSDGGRGEPRGVREAGQRNSKPSPPGRIASGPFKPHKERPDESVAMKSSERVSNQRASRGGQSTRSRRRCTTTTMTFVGTSTAEYLRAIRFTWAQNRDCRCSCATGVPSPKRMRAHDESRRFIIASPRDRRGRRASPFPDRNTYWE